MRIVSRFITLNISGGIFNFGLFEANACAIFSLNNPFGIRSICVKRKQLQFFQLKISFGNVLIVI